MPVALVEVRPVHRAAEVVAQAEGVADLVGGDREIDLAPHPVAGFCAAFEGARRQNHDEEGIQETGQEFGVDQAHVFAGR